MDRFNMTNTSVNSGLTTRRPDDHRTGETPKHFPGAFAPFPRSTWIHPHVPLDNFDRVCKVIWGRAKEAEEEPGRGPSGCETSPGERTEEQQKETQREEGKRQRRRTELAPARPYLSGRRHPGVAKSARALSPVMEGKMDLNKGKTERKGNWENDEQLCLENSLKKVCIPVFESQQSPTSEQATNPIRPAAEDTELHLITEEDPPLPSDHSERSESVDEQNTSDSSDSDSSADEDFTLPGVRSCATESSADDMSYSSDDTSDGDPPDPTKPQPSGKMHGQREISPSVHPHNIPADTLASGSTAPEQAPLQDKAEAPQANSKTIAPLAAQTQQEPYDLLADFPGLQPPTKPLAPGELHDGNPKTKDAKGKREIIQRPNNSQETGATHQSRMKNVPRELSSICARDQKSTLDLQTLGCTVVSCETMDQPSPKVAGTDGVGVKARSWACTAKAGMKQAAASQEKARPCCFQQIVTINGAKATAQDFTNRATPQFLTHNYQHQGANTAMAGPHRGPWPCNPKPCVRPDYTAIHQHFGAHAPGRAERPPRCWCPRFQVCYVPAVVVIPVRTSLAPVSVRDRCRRQRVLITGTLRVTIGGKVSQPDLCRTQGGVRGGVRCTFWFVGAIVGNTGDLLFSFFCLHHLSITCMTVSLRFCSIMFST